MSSYPGDWEAYIKKIREEHAAEVDRLRSELTDCKNRSCAAIQRDADEIARLRDELAESERLRKVALELRVEAREESKRLHAEITQMKTLVGLATDFCRSYTNQAEYQAAKMRLCNNS